MKKTVTIVLVLLFVAGGALFAQRASAPGLADTFYRGITTVVVSDTTEIVTVRTVVSSYVETREIGTGQVNGPNGNQSNLQDRTVEVVTISVYEVRTIVSEQHHGVAHSNGKPLGTITNVTQTLVSSDTVTEHGEWGPAYSLPSGTR